MAQDTKPALRIERCHTYQKSWAVFSNQQQLTFAQLSDVIVELTTCKSFDPAFSAQYERTENEILVKAMARYYSFIERHKLWDQFLAEDAQGHRLR